MGNKPRIPRLRPQHKEQARWLLPMEYTPSELAAAIGCSVNTIYRAYTRGDLPYRRTASGRVFIAGPEFAAWVKRWDDTRRQGREGRKLKPGQAWCVVCFAPRTIKDPWIDRGAASGRDMLRGTCHVCGTELYRILPQGSANDLPR